MSEDIFITIIGGGVVGCAIALEISKEYDKNIVVIEKNRQINGENQSSRNSGVIHAGIYYNSNTEPLKAELCTRGNKLLYKFCAENNIAHKKTGKLVVALNALEEEYLENIYRIALANEIPGIKIINSKEVKKFEPNISAKSALYVPTSGIIDQTGFVSSLYRQAESLGAMFLTGNKAINIEPDKEGFNVTIQSDNETETFKTVIIINSAGLYSDEIAKIINTDSPYEIDPIKGESAKFYKSARESISINEMSVYPVPYGYLSNGERLNVPFKEFQKLYNAGKINKSVGVHLTSTLENKGNDYFISDTVTIGPAYSKPEGKEDYKPTRNEDYFLSMVNQFFPNLKLKDISLHQAGIRAKLKGYTDFVIERDTRYSNFINLVGIDSPGLTSALAIAKHVKQMLKNE